MVSKGIPLWARRPEVKHSDTHWQLPLEPVHDPLKLLVRVDGAIPIPLPADAVIEDMIDHGLILLRPASLYPMPDKNASDERPSTHKAAWCLRCKAEHGRPAG